MNLKFIYSLLIIVLIISMSACSQSSDEHLVSLGDDHQKDFLQEGSIATTKSSTAMYPGIEISNGPKINNEVTHGLPNKTEYNFYIANPTSDIVRAVVKFTIPSGGELEDEFEMQKKANGNFFLLKKLSQSGHYEVRYIGYDRFGNSIIIPKPNPAYVDNTIVDVSGSVKKLVWPFGADGSSWSNREVTINGIKQAWKSGAWDGGPGYGHNEGSHIGNQKYADDWNRGTGSQDKGAEIRSPLDGRISKISTYHVEGYGDSNQVTVVQKIGDKEYSFAVGHLEELPAYLYHGKYVRAGIDKIGNVGKSGAAGYHAHTSLHDITNKKKIPVKFDFSAKK